MTDELLTSFRSNVPLADDTTARQAYAHATRGRRRLPRRRLVLAVAALILAGALAGTLSATLGGASPNRDLTARQQIVDKSVAQVQGAFGDGLVVSAGLYGAELTVKLAAEHPPSSVVAQFEASILAGVADENLHGAGLPGIDAVEQGDGAVFGDGVSLPRNLPSLPDGACRVASDAVPAHATVASARVVPLLGGFCVFKLDASDLAAFANEAPVTVSKLPELTNARSHLIEVYDETGTLQIVQWWSPFTGAEPGDAGPLGQGQGGSWTRPPLCDPFALGGGGVCG